MKTMRRGTCILLCLGLLLCALPAMVPIFTAATAADEQEEQLLGTLSQRFEASGPGVISSGSGDQGGKSYGAYQFSSRSGIPREFFLWCLSSADAYYRSIGERLSEAYEADGGYGSTFDETWRALAKEDSDGFLRVQRNYVRRSYYDPIVRTVEAAVPGFDMDNYSIALRNVFWSRAVQHGVGGASGFVSSDGRGGATGVILRAFDSLGGFANQPEAELIEAIYKESGAVYQPQDGSTRVMTGSTAEKYGISGMALKYYDGNSGDVQLGVYTRLRINEPAKAQVMLAEYGFRDAPLDEGVYQLCSASNSKLAATADSDRLTLSALGSGENQQFRLDYHASGYYTITCVENGLRLSASGSGVTLSAPSADNNQLWHAAVYNSGFSLENRATGTYLSVSTNAAGGRLTLSGTAMQWQLSLAHSGWSLEGASYPTIGSSLTVGQSGFPFRGTLRSSYTIKKVTVSVLNSSGGNAISPASATPNAKSYDLSRLDDAVAFSRLGAGGYTLVIAASNGAGDSFRLESRFYVTDGSYVISFDPCGGTCSESTRLVSAGQKYGELPTATKDGYAFVGWFTQPEGGQQITADMTTGAQNLTLYARYQARYTYRFLNYDGSVVASGQLAAGEPIPLPGKTPVRPNDQKYSYTFTGWEGYESGMCISADVSFTACYEAKPLETLPPEISSSVYRISGSYLRSIPSGTTARQLLQGLSPAAYLSVSVSGDSLVGTGTTISYVHDGQTIQTLTAVVTGDLNGDGRVSISDIVCLQAHLLGKRPLEGAAFQAADVNGDGQVSIADIIRLQSHLLGRSSIQPN